MTSHIRRITADDLFDLDELYRDSDGPSQQFLGGLLSKTTTQSWLLALESGAPGAAIWFTVVAGEAELIDIRVTSAHRGKGMGRLLLSEALSCLQVSSVQRVFLEVRRSNLVAQNLYRSLSFSKIGERTNYYPSREGREDAILMALDLSVTR
jgi:ribosomal-protein-alanine N-acetyltransferase